MSLIVSVSFVYVLTVSEMWGMEMGMGKESLSIQHLNEHLYLAVADCMLLVYIPVFHLVLVFFFDGRNFKGQLIRIYYVNQKYPVPSLCVYVFASPFKITFQQLSMGFVCIRSSLHLIFKDRFIHVFCKYIPEYTGRVD